jgi:hypothetical protein
MEPALKILPDVSGEIAGRSLEEWNAAYVKVENYFHALRIRNKPLLGQLVLRVLERAQRRAPAEPRPQRHGNRRRGNGSHRHRLVCRSAANLADWQ